MNHVRKRNSLLTEIYLALQRRTIPARYSLFLRGNALILIGYIIGAFETLLANFLGLTSIPLGKVFCMFAPVLTVSIYHYLLVRYKHDLQVWLELVIYTTNLVVFLVGYPLWVYALGDFRILGLFWGVTAVIVVLSYTNAIQSLLMSIPTSILYIAVVIYDTHMKGEAVNMTPELFLAAGMLPAFILVSVTADSLFHFQKRLELARNDLEEKNTSLSKTNTELCEARDLTNFEMNLAREIQAALFPSTVPDVRDWDMAFISRPRYGVSGDFCDFYHHDGSLNGLALFDVSGHGVAAGLVTILAKPVLSKHFANPWDVSLGSVLSSTNASILGELGDVQIFVTGILLRFKGDRVEYVNAGHPELMHLVYATGAVVKEGENLLRGLPMGIAPSTFRYSSQAFTMASGDFIVVFSDCLTEARNVAGDQFGRDRLSGAFGRAPRDSARSVLDHILDEFYSFVGGVPLGDDLTVIVARKL